MVLPALAICSGLITALSLLERDGTTKVHLNLFKRGFRKAVAFFTSAPLFVKTFVKAFLRVCVVRVRNLFFRRQDSANSVVALRDAKKISEGSRTPNADAQSCLIVAEERLFGPMAQSSEQGLRSCLLA